MQPVGGKETGRDYGNLCASLAGPRRHRDPLPEHRMESRQGVSDQWKLSAGSAGVGGTHQHSPYVID